MATAVPKRQHFSLAQFIATQHMNPVIASALIAASTTIVAVILTWVLSNFKSFPLLRESRRTLDGSWSGTTYQDVAESAPPTQVELVLTLKTNWHRISGTCRVRGGGDELNVELLGGYSDVEHVYFKYKSLEKNKINSGFVLLRLNANGTSLVGKMIGYGNMSEAVIKGDMVLTKTGG